MQHCSIADYNFTLKPCKNLSIYFPTQKLEAWHCSIETKKYKNPKLCASFNLWLAGNNQGPSDVLLHKALEIRSDIQTYIDHSRIFDLQWLNSIKPHSFYAGIEEFHNFRQDQGWFSGIFLLDELNPRNFVISEFYGCSRYYTLFKENKPCDKIIA